MNIDKGHLLLPVIVAIVLFCFFYIKTEKKIAKIIVENWLMSQSRYYYGRLLLFLIGTSLLLLSLLDLRGPEDRQDSNIPDQKTIIIIDSSASMLVEDVRPSRYEKALLLARHFIKKAVGHQISIVLFSDIQNRIVPFTDDLDLLDTRVAALEDNNNVTGGSNIAQALDETLSYFRSSNKSNTDATGNILILTDSEGHDGNINRQVPDGINVAVVGIGTRRGGKVPIRDSRGVFRGYKKFQGQEVESKLNEEWIASLGKKIKNYRYWIVNSYVMPTEEIVAFFRSQFAKGLALGSVRVKPVLAHYLMIPGIVMMIISFVLYPLKRFYIPCFIIFSLFLSGQFVKGEEGDNTAKTLPLTEEMTKLENDLRAGDIEHGDAVYLASKYLEHNENRKAEILFNEYKKKLDEGGLNNYGLALLKNKKYKESLDILNRALQSAKAKPEENKELIKLIKKNIVEALRKQKNDNKKQQENQKKQDKKEQQENQKNQDKKEQQKNQKNQDKKEQQKNQKNQDKKEQQKSQKKQENQKNQDKKNKKENGRNEKSNEVKQKTPQEKLREKERKQAQKRKMKKVPGIIKQILSDDRKLQKMYIDTSTKSKNNRPKKDW